MGVLNAKMNGTVAKPPSAQLLAELPFRLVFSVALAVLGVCLYIFVPAVQSSPYLYVVILLLAFALATWGFRNLRLPAWGTATSRASILEVSAVVILGLVVFANNGVYRSLVAMVRSLLCH
jgi:hypothetical protein